MKTNCKEVNNRLLVLNNIQAEQMITVILFIR